MTGYARKTCSLCHLSRSGSGHSWGRDGRRIPGVTLLPFAANAADSFQHLGGPLLSTPRGATPPTPGVTPPLLRALDEAIGAARRQSEERAFARDIAACGFASVGDLNDALRTQEEMDALEQRIRNHEASLGAARKRAETAQAAGQGIVAPDLESLAEQAQDAADQVERATLSSGELASDLRKLDSLATDLGAVAREMETLDARYATTGRLAEVASGKNALRVSFERYLLGALLDEVLRKASTRMRAMSQGRYDLLRSHEGADRRAAGGLDLEVSDFYTGTSRSVTTLSGGESFLASLSLALGLADTVQSLTGGLRLDTVFIDEGFGSLDPEALDLAIRTLIDLQQGGRLVGIISHVPELKERIDARLEVVPGRAGSGARFQIG
jgi:exonuclease SbcC